MDGWFPAGGVPALLGRLFQSRRPALPDVKTTCQTQRMDPGECTARGVPSNTLN